MSHRTNLLHVWLSNNLTLHVEIGITAFVLLLLFVMVALVIKYRPGNGLFYHGVEELNISLGGQHSIKIKPNHEVAQIAHKAWAELVTRKAGLMFDPDHDVIVEVYSSWYELFKEMRALIKDIDASRLKNADTLKLVNLLVDSLNKGVRPHLTKWQAKFRKWYTAELEKDRDNKKSPQEIQKGYPHYDEMVKELKEVNQQFVSYANEIKKLIDAIPIVV